MDDGKAVALRQHAVDDQHVVLAVERQRLAFLAVGRLVGNMADLAERLDQIIGRVAIVLNNEKAHAVLPWSGNLAGSGSLAARRPASNHIFCQPLSAMPIQDVNQAAGWRSAAPPCDRNIAK